MSTPDPHTTAINAGRLLAVIINGSEASAVRRGALGVEVNPPIPAHQRERYNAPGGLLSMAGQRRLLEAAGSTEASC